MINILRKLIIVAALAVSLTSCANSSETVSDDTSANAAGSQSQTVTEETSATEAPIIKEDLGKYFTDITLTDTYKKIGENNPLMTQRFGADPYAISYGGRVYIYMTGDVLEYNSQGDIIDNTYSQIKTLNVISSEDMVNWTDHGWIVVNGAFGVSEWGGNSWAPAVAHKEIDGKDKFFIYFANGGNGIGVLEGDSPLGPFTDPIKKPLISRSTPNCSDVTWLFDPAVLVDDDGRAYIYFGGGIPGDRVADPGTGRAAELGADMISLASDPVRLDVPYLFEDSGINRIGDTYYYSYCSNWQVDYEGKKLGLESANIVYMTSKNPLGPFELVGSIYKNPGNYFGFYGNNHHCIFNHLGEWYIAYHTQVLENRSGAKGGYRSTNIDSVTVNDDGTIQPSKYTMTGVNSISNLNPLIKTQAETIGAMAGITVKFVGERALYAEGDIVVSDISTGDWILVYGADFGTGANNFTANVSAPKEGFGVIEIRQGGIEGEILGYLKVDGDNPDEFKEINVELDKQVSGINDLAFIFYGEGFDFDYWYFS